MPDDALKRLDGLNDLIEEKMKEWQVPGLAIGLVKDGEVVLTEGFGCRNVRENLKVTPDTVIPIGSASKTFTSLALGILADDGQLDWDTPVREYMPFFSMYDAALSDKVTARDMLCHRTGLPRHDLSWINSAYTRRELVGTIRHLQPSEGFRSTFQYQNHMFTAAGYLVEAITGKTWEQFIKERVFDRLGMADSNFTVKDLQTLRDYSKPYTLKQDKVIEDKYLPVDAIGPAGSINSTARDMSKYLVMQLAKGKCGDEQIVSEERLREMHTPHIPAAVYPWNFEEVQFTGYGLGWFIDMYRGHKVIHHGGNVVGFTSLVTQLQEKNFGIVILTNMNSTFLTMALTNTIVDRVLGLEEIDWSGRYRAEKDKLFAQMDEMQEETKKNRIPDTRLSHGMEDYTGRFEHPAYGYIEVALKDGAFSAKHNLNDVAFRHYHYDTFEFTTILDISLLATYTTNSKGEIDGITLPFEEGPGIDAVAFKKKTVE